MPVNKSNPLFFAFNTTILGFAISIHTTFRGKSNVMAGATRIISIHTAACGGKSGGTGRGWTHNQPDMSRSLCQLSYSPILLAGTVWIERTQQVLGTRSPTLEHSPLHLISSIQSSLTVKVSLETNRLISIHTTVYGGKVAGTAGIEPTFRESKSRVLAVTLHPFNKKKK